MSALPRFLIARTPQALRDCTNTGRLVSLRASLARSEAANVRARDDRDIARARSARLLVENVDLNMELTWTRERLAALSAACRPGEGA